MAELGTTITGGFWALKQCPDEFTRESMRCLFVDGWGGYVLLAMIIGMVWLVIKHG